MLESADPIAAAAAAFPPPPAGANSSSRFPSLRRGSWRTGNAPAAAGDRGVSEEQGAKLKGKLTSIRAAAGERLQAMQQGLGTLVAMAPGTACYMMYCCICRSCSIIEKDAILYLAAALCVPS
jgi:hypothetical protein